MFHLIAHVSSSVQERVSSHIFFSNQEMHTFSRIRAHQSTSETINTSVWRRKINQLLSTTSPSWFWRRIKLAVHFRDEFLSFLCCVEQHGLKITFHHNVKADLCHFSTNIPAFFPVFWLARGRYPCLHSVSHLIYRAFGWYFLRFFCYCTAG